MSINFLSDIIPFFSTDVITDPDYQAGGTYSLPAFFGALNLLTVSIHSGNAGTGYTAGDIVTLSGGSLYSGGAAGTVTVLTVDGSGVALTVAIKTVGQYLTLPSNGISVTGGSGSGLKIDATWTGYAAERILTWIEITRTYFNQIDDVHEAKILQEVMGRIISSMRFGSPSWNITSMPANAKKAALEFIAHHNIPSDI